MFRDSIAGLLHPRAVIDLCSFRGASSITINVLRVCLYRFLVPPSSVNRD